MAQITWAFGRGPRAATEEQQSELAQIFTLDKEFGKGLVPAIRGAGGKGNFAVTSQANTPRLIPFVGQGNAPKFDIVVGPHKDLHLQKDPVVAPAKFSHMGMKGHFFKFTARAGWLAARRPVGPTFEIL